MKEILRRVWENLFSQLSGPLNFRFIVQPAFAGYLAIRAGLKDAQQNRLTFLWAAIINSASRHTLSRQFWNDGWKVFALAMVVDAIYQVIVQRGVYVLELLIVATSLALFHIFCFVVRLVELQGSFIVMWLRNQSQYQTNHPPKSKA